jgi:hypothetical protein
MLFECLLVQRLIEALFFDLCLHSNPNFIFLS